MRFSELPKEAIFESGIFSDSEDCRKPFKKIGDEPVKQFYLIPGLLGVKIQRFVNAIRMTDNLPLSLPPDAEVYPLDQ